MVDEQECIETHQSFHLSDGCPKCYTQSRWNSEGHFPIESDITANKVTYLTRKEYYKRYEYDELPVKDDNSLNDHSFSEENDSRTAAYNDSITNSVLDKLEIDDTVENSYEQYKLLKTFIDNRFNDYYQNKQDIDECKKRFKEILQRNKGDSIEDMSKLIIDMLKHISSSESVINSKLSTIPTKCTAGVDGDTTLQSFKNENYTTESTANSSKIKSISDKDSLNIFILQSDPCLKIWLKNRDLFSDINIREKFLGELKSHLVSADNIRNLLSKQKLLERTSEYREGNHNKEREIPIKSTNAKKNIYLNEDFSEEKGEGDTFFIFKICSYLCKKIRKSPFA